MTRQLLALACAMLAAVPLLAGARAPHVARPTSAPLSVTLLYDLSVGVSSVPLAKDEGFKRIVQWVVADLKTADQLRLGLLTEGRRLTRPYMRPEFRTLWRDVIAKASVPDAERYGASPLWDHLDAVVRAVAQDPGRRAILVVTDGRSTGNHISVQTLIADAKASGVSIWPIEYGPSEWYLPDRDGRTTHPSHVLSQIATATGGRFASEPDRSDMTSMEAAFLSAYTVFQRDIVSILHALHE